MRPLRIRQHAHLRSERAHRASEEDVTGDAFTQAGHIVAKLRHLVGERHAITSYGDRVADVVRAVPLPYLPTRREPEVRQ